MSNMIEVADAMNPWEPTGKDHGKGKSAEFRVRVRARDGVGENISVTVRGDPAVALSACMEQGLLVAKSVGAPAGFFSAS